MVKMARHCSMCVTVLLTGFFLLQLLREGSSAYIQVATAPPRKPVLTTQLLDYWNSGLEKFIWRYDPQFEDRFKILDNKVRKLIQDFIEEEKFIQRQEKDKQPEEHDGNTIQQIVDRKGGREMKNTKRRRQKHQDYTNMKKMLKVQREAKKQKKKGLSKREHKKQRKAEELIDNSKSFGQKLQILTTSASPDVTPIAADSIGTETERHQDIPSLIFL
ncbi:glutamic acid-rich protein-like isoform X1 [Periplaneta americana]|uniref:glutamic acid-rich protein-like isoform X1 n=1 Tax=Periplaneta americana TaxID=6978 RepID=UPI0037E977EC